MTHICVINSLRPRRNGCYNADDIFKCIFLKENVWIPTKISLKIVPKGPINNIPALVQKMAWCRPGDKPLSEPMLIFVPTHICVTRPQWVLSPDRCLAFIRTNAGILLIGPLGTYFSEILIEIHCHIFIEENAFENVVWKMAAILSQPQCVKQLLVAWYGVGQYS